MNAFSEAQKSPAGEAAKYDNCVQVNFDINFRLITPNFYDNRSNSSGECCWCDPGGQFLGDALFHRSCVCMPCLVAARPFHKRTFLCHSRLLLCHSSTFITLMSLKFWTLYVIQKHSYVIRALWITSICNQRISPVDVGGYQQKTITMIISHAMNWCAVCDAAIECTIRELWDCMFGLHPQDLEWRLQNREHLVSYLKTSPMDWLNYYVSGWWMKIAFVIARKEIM